jgi:hypothetical protein
MGRENMFFVEKHSNDTLHNPQRAGTSHTDREIQAAASALGRDSVSVEAGHVRRARASARVARVLDEGEAVGDGAVVLGAATHPTSRRVRPYDAAVVRIDLAALPGGATGATPASQQAHRPTPRLDANSRRKTETRVAAGGTGGAALLESARRAARHLERAGPAAAAAARATAPAEYLTKRRRDDDDDDDDGPVIVSAGDVTFGDDGWCVGERAAEAAANVAAVSQRAREAAEAAEADAREAAAEDAARRLRESAKRKRLQAELARRLRRDGEEGGASNPRADTERRRRRNAPGAAPLSFEVED